MDWHKLQHTLYNLDPTDPREDLAKLQQSARTNVPDIPSIDYINESIEIPKGSMPLDINSVNDFAKLAGVTIKENFAKGFQAVQPGGALGPDAAERAIKSLVTPKDDNEPKQQDQQKSTPKVKGSINASRLAKQLNIQNSQSFIQAIQLIKQGKPITSVNHYKALGEAFVRLMQIDPQDTQIIMTQLKKVEAEESEIQTKEYTSIKEELYRRLNSKK